jgi:hypothetical protein
MKLSYTFLLLAIPVLLSAQSIQLRGKVINDDQKPVSNLQIRFTSYGEAVTTGSGEFLITIPQNVSIVDVVIKDVSWQILYPVDAKIIVPADHNIPVTIIVSEVNNSGVKSMDESIIRYAELESLLKNVGATNTELKSFLEKFIELEAKKLEISETKLRQEFERKEKRDTIFTEISPILNEYILRINNLKTNYEMYYEQAFVSNQAVEHLNYTIRAYNPVFDTIYYNQNKWQNDINSAWDAVLSENFATSVNYMIDEIHTPYILKLNEYTKSINDVRLKVEKDGKSPEELKSEVRTKVSDIMNSLEIKIPILENRFNNLLTRLQHSGIN